MTKTSTFVGLTLPSELVLAIEKKRGDLPRSYVYRKLIEGGYQNNCFPQLKGIE